MKTKPYLLGFPLFVAFFLSGCAEKPTPAPLPNFDIPLLFTSNFEQARTILGPPNINRLENKNGFERFADWGKAKQWRIIIAYRADTHLPITMLVTRARSTTTTDQEAFFKAHHLTNGDPRYRVDFVTDLTVCSTMDCAELRPAHMPKRRSRETYKLD